MLGDAGLLSMAVMWWRSSLLSCLGADEEDGHCVNIPEAPAVIGGGDGEDLPFGAEEAPIMPAIILWVIFIGWKNIFFFANSFLKSRQKYYLI